MTSIAVIEALRIGLLAAVVVFWAIAAGHLTSLHLDGFELDRAFESKVSRLARKITTGLGVWLLFLMLWICVEWIALVGA